jgi:hypothetical protein
MSKNPFIILGITENATRDEAGAAYNSLRAKYEGLRFEAGEVGSGACQKLEELEQAYSDALEIIDARDGVKSDADGKTQESFTQVNLQNADLAIRENRMDDAQKYLDDCTTRTAEWHYLQSAIFYRKNWAGDALKQLELSCNMEPNNKKYADAKDAMQKHVSANTTAREHSFYNNGTKQERSYADSESGFTRDQRGCSVCDVCSSLLCADCCCECMGGDLIPCC